MSAWRISMLVALALVGCAHTSSTETVKPVKARPNPKQTPAAVKPDSAAPRDERPAADAGRPELSNSPDGLMSPSGPAVIQKALEKLGYLHDHNTRVFDTETSGALRKFQADQHMARTGAPDRDTLRALGVSPEKVFRQTQQSRDAGE